MRGVGVQFMCDCITSLSRIHGGKMLGPTDRFNEIIAHLGEAEQQWKKLANDPNYKPDDQDEDEDEDALPAEQKVKEVPGG